MAQLRGGVHSPFFAWSSGIELVGFVVSEVPVKSDLSNENRRKN